MIRNIVILGCVMLLGGCKTLTVQQNIAGVCQGIASSEQAIAVFKDKLSDAQRAQIAKAIAVKAPICNVAPYPTTISDAAYQELQGVLITLQGVHKP